MRLLAAFLVAVLLLCTVQAQKKKCKTKTISVSSSEEVLSPGYPESQVRHSCFPYKFKYKAPAGKVLKLSCSEFNIACSRRGMSRFLSAGGQKKCGTSFPDVVSDGNSMSVVYRSANKRNKKFDFKFKCTIEAIEAPEQEECECGSRMGSFRSRIVGGQEAEEKERPYQVSIQWRGQHICGGSLISKRWVVTAAHCEITTGSYKVVLGEHTLSKKSGTEKAIAIEKVINHKHYDYGTNQFDIALIKLKNEVEYNDYIQPICLPDSIKDNSLVGEELVASGWGVTKEGSREVSDKLQEVSLKVISNSECKSKGGYYATDIFSGNLCTLTPKKDACQGDSGGPLAYMSPSERFYLIGVTSWGIGCARDDQPGVWTDCINPSILEWIRTNSGMKCKSS